MQARAGELHVWTVDLGAVDDASAAPCISVLDEPELERWKAIRPPDRRREYLVAHALLRHALSVQAGVPAGAWAFEAAAGGKPHVVRPAAARHLRFNLSHAPGRVAVVVSDGIEVGIDVEPIRPVDIDAIAAAHFHAKEVSHLGALPADRRAAAFFTCWTLKEAWLKGIGIGLHAALDHAWFDLAAPGTELLGHLDESLRSAGEAWQLASFVIDAEHHLSLAANAHGIGRLAVRWHAARLVNGAFIDIPASGVAVLKRSPALDLPSHIHYLPAL
jgi:4'-phosphopantetheinyl transferase